MQEKHESASLQNKGIVSLQILNKSFKLTNHFLLIHIFFVHLILRHVKQVT